MNKTAWAEVGSVWESFCAFVVVAAVTLPLWLGAFVLYLVLFKG